MMPGNGHPVAAQPLGLPCGAGGRERNCGQGLAAAPPSSGRPNHAHIGLVTGACPYDAPTLRHSGAQAAPYLHWPSGRWCLERQRFHRGYRSHSDRAGDHPLRGEQDRHRRCKHCHVSTANDWAGSRCAPAQRDGAVESEKSPGAERAQVRSLLLLLRRGARERAVVRCP
jgi:hypothetical protein